LTEAGVTGYDLHSDRRARREVGMDERITAVREMIGEYEEERIVAGSRLDQQVLRRTRLELAREVLAEHGEIAEAERLLLQIHDMDHHIRASRENIARIDGLIAIYEASLDILLRKGEGR
jgi:hypothetical protein